MGCIYSLGVVTKEHLIRSIENIGSSEAWEAQMEEKQSTID